MIQHTRLILSYTNEILKLKITTPLNELGYRGIPYSTYKPSRFQWKLQKYTTV